MIMNIAELKAAVSQGQVEATLRVELAKKEEKLSSNGNPYFEITLADFTGQETLRLWSNWSPYNRSPYDQVDSLKVPRVVDIKGIFYNKKPYGLDYKNLEITAVEDEVEVERFYMGSEGRQKELQKSRDEADSYVAGLKDPRLRALCEAFLKEYGDSFGRAAAAYQNHHARIGGLLEHTVQMMRAADALCGVYQNLNRDLLMAGVLLHDCGKIWETCAGTKSLVVVPQLKGELMGHVTIGIEVINSLWRDLPKDGWEGMQPDSDHVRLHLVHLVASHHGEYEFGAPVKPKTPEAIVLHFVDNLDAKIEMMVSGWGQAAVVATEISDWVKPLGHRLVKPLDKFQQHVEKSDQFDSDMPDRELTKEVESEMEEEPS